MGVDPEKYRTTFLFPFDSFVTNEGQDFLGSYVASPKMQQISVWFTLYGRANDMQFTLYGRANDMQFAIVNYARLWFYLHVSCHQLKLASNLLLQDLQDYIDLFRNKNCNKSNHYYLISR